MGHSRVVGFVAFALCLVSCLCESTKVTSENATPVTEEQAKQAVEAAKPSTESACVKAQDYIARAKSVFGRVKPFKTKAEDVQAQARKAAQDYNEVKDFVEEVEQVSNTVITLHLSATKDLELVDASLDELLKEATKLKTECKAAELAITGNTPNFAEIQNKASNIKIAADKLDKNITAIFTIVERVESTEKTMEQNLEKAQMANYRISGIVAGAKIETMVGKADGIFTATENEKDAVHAIVQEMKKHCTNDLIASYQIIKEQCKSATGELTKAKAAVQKSQNAVASIKQQKSLAETALENVQKSETVLSAAEEEVRKAEECVSAVQRSFLQLQSALQTGKDSVTKAKDSQQKLVAALPTTTTKPNTEQITATANAHPPVRDGTELGQKETTMQPTSKDLPDQTDNSEDKPKDALSNGAQNVPTTALTGGKAPAPGAKNDSAMTVSVPLLVALIASAVLQ